MTSPPRDDLALAVSALAGDEQALGQLLTIHQRTAYNVAYRLLGNEADARDVVQDAFLQSLRAVRGDVASPDEAASFRPWLMRVVTNTALTQLRRRPSVHSISVDGIAEALPAREYDDPPRTFERRQVRGDALQALLALPDTQRTALVLREWHELSYDEIAELLGTTRSAVETLLFRARRGFRAAYEGVTTAPEPVGCQAFFPLLSAMVDDGLDAATWRRLEDHLGECPRCRTELEALRRSRQLPSFIPFLALPAGWDPVTTTLMGTAAATGAGAAAGTTSGAAAAGSTGAQNVVASGLLAKLAGVTGTKAAIVAAVAGISVAAATLPPGPIDTSPPPTPPALASPVSAASPIASPMVRSVDGSPVAVFPSPSPSEGTAPSAIPPRPVASPPSASPAPTRQ